MLIFWEITVTYFLFGQKFILNIATALISVWIYEDEKETGNCPTRSISLKTSM